MTLDTDSPSSPARTTVGTPPTDYYERKAGGWCTYGQCGERAAPDHRHCYRHKVKVAARDAKALRARRRFARSRGLCAGAGCGVASETYLCPACRIKAGDLPPTNPERADVGTEALDPWRRDASGWERYRGKGRRGAPAASVVDEQDLAQALKSYERGRQSLVYAHSAAVKALGRDPQREARAAAGSILAGAARAIMEVAVRNLPVNDRAVGLRGRVRDALGEGVDPEMLDDAMIDRVIAAVRGGERKAA